MIPAILFVALTLTTQSPTLAAVGTLGLLSVRLIAAGVRALHAARVSS